MGRGMESSCWVCCSAMIERKGMFLLFVSSRFSTLKISKKSTYSFPYLSSLRHNRRIVNSNSRLSVPQTLQDKTQGDKEMEEQKENS